MFLSFRGYLGEIESERTKPHNFPYTFFFACAVFCQGQCLQFSSPNSPKRWRLSLRKHCPFFGWPSWYTWYILCFTALQGSYNVLLRCRRSFNVSIGLDEASCPGRRASPGINSAPSVLSARCLSLGLKMTVQKKSTKLVGEVGRSTFFVHLFPCSSLPLSLSTE